jgi:hypothetical protein
MLFVSVSLSLSLSLSVCGSHSSALDVELPAEDSSVPLAAKAELEKALAVAATAQLPSLVRSRQKGKEGRIHVLATNILQLSLSPGDFEKFYSEKKDKKSQKNIGLHLGDRKTLHVGNRAVPARDTYVKINEDHIANAVSQPLVAQR